MNPYCKKIISAKPVAANAAGLHTTSILAFGLCVLAGNLLRAQTMSTGTFSGTGSTWSTAVWLPSGVPGSPGGPYVAVFADEIGGQSVSRPIVVDGLFNLNQLNVTAGLKQTLTLTDGGVADRGFHFGGAGAKIALLNDASLVMDANVFFDAAATITSVKGLMTFNAGKTFFIDDKSVSIDTTDDNGIVKLHSNITGGAGSLTKIGTGELWLTSSNSFTGGVNLYAGRLRIDNDYALGTGAFTIGDGVTPSNALTLTLTKSLNIANQLIFNNNLSIVNEGIMMVRTLSLNYVGNVNLSDVRTLSIGDYVEVRMGEDLAFTGAGGLNVAGNVVSEVSFRNPNSTFSGGYTQGLKQATVGIGLNSITLGALDDGHNYIGSGNVSVVGLNYTLTLNPGAPYTANLHGRVALDWGAIFDVVSGTTVFDGATLINIDPDNENRFIFRGDTVFTGVNFENAPTLYFTAAAGRKITFSGAGMGAGAGKMILDGSGTIALAANAANIGAAQINLESGALVLGADNQIRADSALYLGEGVTLRTGGYSADFTDGLTWSNAGTRIIDLGNGGGSGSILKFGAGTTVSTGTIYVQNWKDGVDRLSFSDPITSAMWGTKVRFDGYNWGLGVDVVNNAGAHELIPAVGAMAGSGTYEWTGSASFSTGVSSTNMWSAPGNWDLNRVPEFGAGTTMVFGTNFSYAPTVTFPSGTLTVGTILFSKSGSNLPVTISSGTLIMDSGTAGVPARMRKSYYDSGSITSAIRLNSDLILDRTDNTVPSGSYYRTLSGVIRDGVSGTSITVNGGAWYLGNASNTFTGGIVLNAGYLWLANSTINGAGVNSPMGKGALTIYGGVLQGYSIYNSATFMGTFKISSPGSAGYTHFYSTNPDAANPADIIWMPNNITINGYGSTADGWGNYAGLYLHEGRDLRGSGSLAIAGNWDQFYTCAANSSFSGGFSYSNAYSGAGTIHADTSTTGNGSLVFGTLAPNANYLGTGNLTFTSGNFAAYAKTSGSHVYLNNVSMSINTASYSTYNAPVYFLESSTLRFTSSGNFTASHNVFLSDMYLVGYNTNSQSGLNLSTGANLYVGNVTVSNYPNLVMNGDNSIMAAPGTSDKSLIGLGRFTRNNPSTTLTTTTIDSSIAKLGAQEFYVNSGRLKLTLNDQIVTPSTGTVALGATGIINSNGVKNTFGKLAINGASTLELGTGGELTFSSLAQWGDSGGVLHLLNIQNDSGGWNTFGGSTQLTSGSEHVWFSSTAVFTSTMLDNIAFTGYTRGATFHLDSGSGLYELTPSGEDGSEWSGAGGNNNWNTGANWFGSKVPDAVGAIAIFRDADDAIGTKTIMLNGNRTLGEIYFEATTGETIRIGGAADQALTFDNSGSAAKIYFGGASTPTISANIVLSNTHGLLIDHQASAKTLTLSGIISGTGGILFTVDPAALANANNQNYYLALSGSNTFSGGVEQKGGRLYINHNNALGTGTYTISGTASIQSDNASRTLTNALILDGGLSTYGSTLTFKSGTGLITDTISGTKTAASGTKTIYVESTSLVFDSDYVLKGPGALSIRSNSRPSSSYVLTMRGQNIFTGGVSLNNGGQVVIGASSQTEDFKVVSGPLGTGTFTIGNGGVYVENTGSSYTIHNPLAMGSSNTTYLGRYATGVVGSGTLIFESVENFRLNAGTNTFSLMGAQIDIANSITNPASGAAASLAFQPYSTSSNYAGFIRLSSSNSFTGGVSVNGSYYTSAGNYMTLSLANDYALGAGRLTLSSYYMTLEAFGPGRTISNLINFNNANYITYFTATNGASSLLLNGAGNSTIAGGSHTWNIANGMTVTFSEAHNLIGTSSILTKTGAGTLKLLGASSTFNGLTISAGTVSTTLLDGRDMVIGASGTGTQDSYFGTGTLSVTGVGAVARINTWVDGDDAGEVIVRGGLSVSNGGLLDIRGGGNLVFAQTGAIATGAGSTSGTISIGDGGWLVKDGPNTITTLDASIVAPILIRGGTLSLVRANLLSNASGLMMTGSGALILNELTQKLSGDWSLTGAATLDFGNKSALGASTWFTVDRLGTWDVNSTLRVTNWWGNLAKGNGRSQIIIGEYTDSLQFIPNVWFAGYGPGAYIVRREGGVIELVPYAVLFKWIGGQNSDWGTAVNWPESHYPDVVGASVSFGDLASATKQSGTSITLDTDKVVGSLVFDDSNGRHFNFSGAGKIVFNIADEDKEKDVTGQIVLDEYNRATVGVSMQLKTDLIINGMTGSNLEIGGQISSIGRYNIMKRGAGTLTLSSGANSYDGGTFLEGGLLRINANETLTSQGYVSMGPISAGALTISGGAIEAYNADRTISNRLILDGDFTVAGSNTLTFAYDASKISGAQKSIINSASVAINVADAAGKLTFTAANTLTGTGRLIKDGAGTLELQGAHEYTGGTEIRQGTLAVSDSLSMNTQDVAFTGNSTLRLDADTLNIANAIDIAPAVTATINTLADTGTLSGIITGDGALAKAGTGTLTLTSSNAYTGNTNITAGALIATDAGALSSGAVNVAANAKAELVFNTATVANTFTGAGETIVTGTDLRLTADNTDFTGTWSVDGSALVASPANLGANSTVIIGGTLTADGGNNFTFASKLGGAGVLDFNATGANRFGPNAGAHAPGFTGLVNSNAGNLLWDANASAVLASATLALNGGLLDIAPGAQNAQTFTVAGGTMAFTGTANVTNFAITGSSNIIFDHAVMQTVPILQQDEGSGRAYVIAQNWDEDITNLHLITADGALIGASSTLAVGTGTEAYGIYSNTLTVAGGTLGVAYRLTELQLQAGKTLVLDNDTAVPTGGDELHALISGDGSLEINATGAITLNTVETYTGTTFTTTGTLKAGVADVIASSAALVNNAVFDTNGHDQTLNNLAGTGTLLNSAFTTLHSTADSAYAGLITGTGGIAKTGAATLTLSSSNAYTGGSVITGGTLRLADLGATGTGNILNNASLDLAAPGAFSNNISGSGTTHVSAGSSGNYTVLSGSNQTFWHITGVAQVTRQDNLGDGSVDLDGGSLLLTSATWNFTNALTGDGLLIADLSPSTGAFTFAQSAARPAAFTGSLDMRSGFFTLDATAAGVGASTTTGTGVMRESTLILGANGSTLLGSGTYYLGGLSFDGGTLKVEMTDATKPKGMLTVGDLNAPAMSKVALDNWDKVAATMPEGTDFFFHDSGTRFQQIVRATGIIGDAGARLDLYDFDGNLISDPGFKQIRESDNSVSGTAVYDYGALVVDDGADKGLYLAYMLRKLSANAGANITLSNIGTQDTANTLTAQLTGSGGFIMSGTGVYFIGSADSDYTGTTSITSGTLALYSNNALGNTALLDIAANTGVNLNGKTQAIGALDTAAGSTLDFAGGELTITGTDASGAHVSSTSNGALTGPGALILQAGTLAVNGANATLAASASINNAATLLLHNAQGFGSGAITADGELAFSSADGANTNAIGGAGLVTATNAANVTLEGNNANFTGTWNIAAGSALKAVGAASLGTGDVTNSGTLIVGASLATPSDYTLNPASHISGSGILAKEDANTVTIGHSNAYTGGSVITGGTLRLADLAATGTGNILNNASLDLAAPGTFSNNINGSGTTHVSAGSSGNYTALSGSNQTSWHITGAAQVTRQDNLGDGSVHIATAGELSLLGMGGDYTFNQQLTGSGTLSINNTGAIAFGSATGTDFTGAAVLRNNRLDLGAANTLALSQATLVVHENNYTAVGSGTQRIGNLTLESGTIAFTLDATGTAAAGTISTGTLALGGSTVVIVDTGSFNNLLPLLQEDERHDIELVAATAHTGATLITGTNLIDQNGNQITDATQRDIVQNNTITASGTYDISAIASGSGMHLGYNLVALDLLDGQITALDSDSTLVAGGAEMHARISGDGSLLINATGAIYINNAGNTYTGTTFVTSGTLVTGNSGALGDTSLLSISSTAAADLLGTTQTVGALDNTGALFLNDGALTIKNGGTSTGLLSGEGTLNLTGGNLLITDANTSLAATTNIAASATATLNHASGLGDAGAVIVGGRLVFDVESTTPQYFAPSLSGAGVLVKTNTGAVAIAAANTGFDGSAHVENGRLILENLLALNTATVRVDAGATLEYHGVSGALANNVNGSGTMRIASSELAIEHDNTIANSVLENALVYISATQALGSDTATVRANANSALIVRLDGARLGHVTLDGAKLGFAHDTPAFHHATLASLAGGNATLIFNTDFTGVSGLKQPGEVADHLTVTGSSAGSLTVRVNALGGLPSSDETAIPLITEANGSAIYQLDSGKLEFGLTEYSLGTGAIADTTLALDPRTWYLYSSGLSHVADAIIDTAALLAKDWHYSLDALYLRMGDVREENLGAPGTGPADSRSTGNLWMRTRGYQLNATSPLSGRSVTQYAYGMTAGGDKAFHTETGVNLLGAFLDMGRITRDFGRGGDGSTNSLSAGLYATLLKNNGWHADFVVKADRYRHTLNVSTATGRPVHGSYTTLAYGASIELGRRFGRADGWWVEPAVQASMAWLDGARYRTTPDNVAIDVKVDNIAAAQYRGMVRFGRQIKDTRWTPYGKFGLAKTDTDGGAIHAHNRDFNPDFDSWRVEFGFGASYRINNASQLYMDYEYGKAAAYERPWALNLGYRRLW